jgi:ketosteroid isomerase-like protein
VEIVVSVIHKNADSFHILREHSSSSKGILERENHFPSLTNLEKKADGGFYLYEDHVWFEDRWIVASLCDE